MVGTFKREVLTKGFQPQRTDRTGRMASEGAVVKTGGFKIEVDWPSVEAILTEQNTDGVLRLLDPAMTELNRQRIAASGGCHVPTVAEKEQLREQLIVGLIGPGATPPPGLRLAIDIAVRLKADWDVPVPSHGGKAAGGDWRQQLDALKKQFGA
jgi:hypothetical protein